MTLIARLRWAKKRTAPSPLPFFVSSTKTVNPFRAIGRAARATNDNGGGQQWRKKENTRSRTRGREKRKKTRKNRSQELERGKGRERGERGGRKRRAEAENPAKKNRGWVIRVTRGTGRLLRQRGFEGGCRRFDALHRDRCTLTKFARRADR